MPIENIRLEVMKTLEPKLSSFMDKFLIPVNRIWQPTDMLPDSQSEQFYDEISDIREEAKELDHDFWVVLIGDMITEEALPTYESWLMDVVGIDQRENNAWSQWIRHWTGEENRHGDLLNKYLYLSGRVDMKKVEQSTHQLINDGFDPGTDRDPYKNFVYTSFQELATNISHKRVGDLAAQKGNRLLAKICRTIAGDEMRHYLAYRTFVTEIFQMDPSGMMNAFAEMMKKRIIMPAYNLKDSDLPVGIFDEFSLAAQRIGVYTQMDYIDILGKLINHWKIDSIGSLTEEAEKSRDYLMSLPRRLKRIAERVSLPESEFKFQWVLANGL